MSDEPVKRYQPAVGVIPGCEEYALKSPYEVYEPCMLADESDGDYVLASDYDRDIKALEEDNAELLKGLADANGTNKTLFEQTADQATTIERLREQVAELCGYDNAAEMNAALKET